MTVCRFTKLFLIAITLNLVSSEKNCCAFFDDSCTQQYKGKSVSGVLSLDDLKTRLLPLLTELDSELSSSDDTIACPVDDSGKTLRPIWINISYSNIDSFESGIFSQLKQVGNLRYVIIENNILVKLKGGDFDGLEEVQNFRLNNNVIRQVDTDTFSNLNQLLRLDISHNRIEELKRGAFDGLNKLNDLNLSHNNIKNVDAEVLPNSKDLCTLDMSNNKLSNLPAKLFFGFCSSHSEASIDLSNNLIEDSLNFKGLDLPSTTLILSNNNFKNLAIGSFERISISKLDLSNNSISYIGRKAFMDSEFNSLHLENNEIAELHHNAFRDVEISTELYLSNNKICSLSDSIFQELKDLKKLYLDENCLMDLNENMFEGLQSLESLSLRANKLNVIVKGSFSKLGSLRVLELSENPIENLDDEVFHKLGHTLVELYLQDCKLKSVQADGFKYLYHLQVLNLNNNEITVLPSREIFKYAFSRNIFLEGNKIHEISQYAFHSLYAYPSLETVSLKNNEISDISVEAFDRISKIKYLDLSNNRLSDITFDAFKGVELISTINAENNLIELPEVIYRFPRSKLLLLGGNKVESPDLSLDSLNIQHIDVISFTNYSFHRENTTWKYVDHPVL